MQHDLQTEAMAALAVLRENHAAIRHDDQARQDLIKGETNLIEAIEKRKRAITVAENEIARLEMQIAKATERKRLAQKHLLNLRQGLAEALYPIGSIMVGNRKVIPSKCADAVEITDKSAIPAEFMKERVTREPDKPRIKAALENGVKVPGAELITGKVKVTL